MAARVAASIRGRNLVVDNSAFQRGGHDIVRHEWLHALQDGRLYRTPIVELEVLHNDRLAEDSSLAFDSVWIASAGALDARPTDPLRPNRTAVTLALGQFKGDRAREVLERLLDLLEVELHADGLQLPARP
jgi:hypothetical protein